MDHLLKRSALEQLAILLKGVYHITATSAICCLCSLDPSLHHMAMEEGIVNVVLATLKVKLNANQKSGDEESSGERDGETVVTVRGFWKACVQCLQRLVPARAEVRERLRKDHTLLMDVFRSE